MNNKKSFMDELDQKLSSRTHENKKIEKHTLSENKIDLKKAWEENVEEKDAVDGSGLNSDQYDAEYYKSQEIERLLQKDKKELKIKKRKNLLRGIFALVTILIIAIVFFVGKDYVQNNLVRKDNVDVTFFGPNSISGFEPFSLNLKVENNTGADIDSSKLIVYYPEGTLNKNLDNEITTDEFTQSITDNNSSSYKVDMALLGIESGDKKIKYDFQYTLVGKSGTYQKTGEHAIKINSSPLNLNFVYPEIVNSGVSKDIIIEVKSNTSKTIRDVSLVVDIDNIFSLNYAVPKPTLSNNTFYFEEISPGETKFITLNGFFTGYNEEQKIINVRLMKNANNSTSKFLSQFLDSSINFLIKEKDITLEINSKKNNSGDIIFTPEKSQILYFNVTNNLPKTLHDVSVKSTISPNFFNKEEVRTTYGFYDSNNDFILWDKNNYKNLDYLDPQKNIKFSATLSPKETVELGGVIKNPESILEVLVTAKSSSNNPETISYKEVYTIKTNTDYGFEEKLTDLNGNLITSKSPAPVLGVPIRYNINWELTTSTSTIDSPKVTAFVPHHSRIVSTHPNLYYNDKDRTITWTPAEVQAFAGYNGYPEKEIDFTLEYIPTIPHLRKNIEILQEKIVSGKDSHTETLFLDTYRPTMTETSILEK